MRLSIDTHGFNDIQKKLLKAADTSRLENVVRLNTSQMQTTAQRLCPVSSEKTAPKMVHGTLRRSIQLDVAGLTGTVKATADYAPYVEYGTRFMKAQPYMRPAFDRQKDIFIKDIKKELIPK